MKVRFLNAEERLEDLLEVRAGRDAAGVCSGHVLPHGESGANSETCPSTFFVCISHLLDDPDLVQEEARALTSQTGARPGNTQSWQGEPPQMMSTGGSFAPSSFVMSPRCTISGK